MIVVHLTSNKNICFIFFRPNKNLIVSLLNFFDSDKSKKVALWRRVVVRQIRLEHHNQNISNG
jgi:hypothetical protein